MFKVIVVEDELVIRQGIIGLINWDALDCQIVKECSNGQEALNYLQDHEVDILVTDIRMPKLDGLLLLERLQEQKKQLKPIILTAFSQFSYAQQAIRYGAVDFIIKNDFVDELPKAITKAIDLIESEVEENAHLSTNMDNRPIELLLEDFLYKIGEAMDKVEPNELHNKQFCVCALECGASILEAVNTDELKLKLEKVLHICLSDYTYWFLITKEKEWLLVIEIDKDKAISDIDTCCQQCIRMSGQLMDISLRIGISKKMGSIQELFHQRVESVTALERCWKNDVSYVVYADGVEDKVDTYSLDLPDNVIELLFAHQQKEALKRFNKWEEAIVRASIPIHGCKMLVLRFCAIILRRLHHYDEGEHVSTIEKNILEAVERAKSLYTLFSICEELMVATHKLIDKKGHIGSYMIHNIDTFIQENYVHNITLEAISRELHVSKSYLSRVYKKKTGITISDAINRYRIKQGKRLLMETRDKIYEISDAIGYEDPAYFTHIFKKYEGCSPTEYRNRLI